jgi:hypothetical protein
LNKNIENIEINDGYVWDEECIVYLKRVTERKVLDLQVSFVLVEKSYTLKISSIGNGDKK